MNQRTTFLEIRAQRPGCLGIIAIIVNAERTPSAVEHIHIGAGFIKQPRNLYRNLRVILAAGWDIEEGLVTIAAGAGGNLNAGAGFQSQSHAFHIALAYQVNQRDRTGIGSGGSGRSQFRAAGLHHTGLLELFAQLRIVPLRVQRPAGHALFQILLTILQQQLAHFMIVGLLAQLTEWRNGCHTIAFPGGHGGIRVGATLQQGAGHAHAGCSRAGVHESHQQPQRRITHIAQLLPVNGPRVHRCATLQQSMEKSLIRIHTGGLQGREPAGRHRIRLAAVHNFIQQRRHLALPAPLAAVNAGVFLHHHWVIMRVIRGAHVGNTCSSGQQVERRAQLNAPRCGLQRGYEQ